MNISSDTESSDSDNGRRYKIDSTRNKPESKIRERSYNKSVVDTNLYSHGCFKSKSRKEKLSFSEKSRSPNRSSRKTDKKRKLTTSSNIKKQYNHELRLHDKDNQHKNPNRREKKTDGKKYHKEKCRSNDECSRKNDYYDRKNDFNQFKTRDLSHTFTPSTENESQKLQSNDVQSLICGPSLPPHMLKIKRDSDTIDNVSISVKRTYGPSLPSSYFTLDDQSIESNANSTSVNECDNEDANLIGPVLENSSIKNETYLQLEKRAIELKLAKLNAEDKQHFHQEREEWMTELPELRTVADIGVTARQFKTKLQDELKDRSIWTETPRDRDNKLKNQSSRWADLDRINREKNDKLNRERRDAEQEDMIRKHKKKYKRDDSLLKMHQKNMKKKSTNQQSVPEERRPFSRDTDLQVNRFDENIKKTIMKKAQLLDTRFSSGQSKFL